LPSSRSGTMPCRTGLCFGREGEGERKRLEPGLEEAEVFRFHNHLETMKVFSLREDPRDGLRNSIHMGIGIHPPGNRDAHELQFWIVMISRCGIPPRRDDAALHRPDAGVDVHCGRKGLGWKCVVGNMGEEALCIDVDAVSSYWEDERDAGGAKLIAEVGHLFNARADVIIVDGLPDADGNRLHVAPRHTAVRVEAFVDDDEPTGLFVEKRIIERQKPADIAARVLLGAHCSAVGEVAEFAHDGAHRFAGATRFPLLDEERILRDPGDVEDDANPVILRHGAHFPEIAEGDRLAAGHVHRCGNGEVGDALRSALRDERAESGNVDVSLEGVRARGNMRRWDDDIAERATGKFLVETRRREVHVPGDHVAVLDEQFRKDVFRPASLVRGDDMAVAVDIPHSFLQVREAHCPRIGLITHHHPSPLLRTHRICSAVREEVNRDCVRWEEERVVPRCHDARVPFLFRRPRKRLHHLDSVWFRAASHGCCYTKISLAPQLVFLTLPSPMGRGGSAKLMLWKGR